MDEVFIAFDTVAKRHDARPCPPSVNGAAWSCAFPSSGGYLPRFTPFVVFCAQEVDISNAAAISLCVRPLRRRATA